MTINTVTFTQSFLDRHLAPNNDEAINRANARWNSGERMGRQQTIIINTEQNLAAAVLDAVIPRGNIIAIDVEVVIDQSVLISTNNHGTINNQTQENYTVTLKGERTGENLRISHLEGF